MGVKGSAQKTGSRTTIRLLVVIEGHDAASALQIAATYFRHATAEAADDDGDLA